MLGIILVSSWSWGSGLYMIFIALNCRFIYDIQHCELNWFISTQLILTVSCCFYNESKACCWWVLRGLYLGNEFVFLSIRLFSWPLPGIFSCPVLVWLRKIHVKIHDSWQKCCNMTFDWMVSLLPSNQKPDFKILVSRCWKFGCIFDMHIILRTYGVQYYKSAPDDDFLMNYKWFHFGIHCSVIEFLCLITVYWWTISDFNLEHMVPIYQFATMITIDWWTLYGTFRTTWCPSCTLHSWLQFIDEQLITLF